MIVHLSQHPVFVGPPFGEPREIVDDALGIGMENVRPVTMDQHAGFIVMVVGVATDVRPAVDHQHALVQPGRQALGQYAAGEPGADDQVVEAAPTACRMIAGTTACVLGIAVSQAQIAHCIFSFINAQV